MISNLVAVGICFFTVLVNLGLLWLSLKLYTEYFKDRVQRR
jgi:hypothetical protein